MGGVTDWIDELWVPDAVREALREPAKRWRNKWRALFAKQCPDCDARMRAGEIYLSCCWTHPTKDVAETRAAAELEQDIRLHGRPLDEYLGAFPVSE